MQPGLLGAHTGPRLCIASGPELQAERHQDAGRPSGRLGPGLGMRVVTHFSARGFAGRPGPVGPHTPSMVVAYVCLSPHTICRGALQVLALSSAR